MRVLVATESSAQERKTLAAVRSLGRSGAEVAVGGDRFFREPFFSRHCRARVSYAAPFGDAEQFLTDLEQHLQRERFDVVLPLSDYTTVALALGKERIERYTRLPLVGPETLLEAHDKWTSGHAARAAGLQTPATYLPRNLDDVRRLAKELRYPCVIKPRKGAGADGVRFPRTPKELEAAFREAGDASDLAFDRHPIVQEFVPGELHDVCLLFREGEPRAALTQKRIRMHPRGGGFGIHNETTDEPELREQAIALLRSLNWHGPALLEFRVDPETGAAHFIELNARYWGTLDLAIQAGIDFPTLACRMAVEGDVEPAFDYEVGLRYRWRIPHGLRQVVGGPARAAAFRELFLPRARTCSDVEWSDPLPLLVKMLRAAGTLGGG